MALRASGLAWDCQLSVSACNYGGGDRNLLGREFLCDLILGPAHLQS
jgi:hypothetical protein